MAAADSSDDTGTLAGPSVVCEVCGSDVASSVLVECCNHGEDHLVGCHAYCLAGHGVRGKKFEEYECLACKEYNRSVNDAVGRAQAGQEASPGEMPELRRVQVGPRVRHGHEAVGLPTEQQRIDQAAAKAAKTRHAAEMDADYDAADAEGHQYPSKRSKIGDKQTAAAAAAGRAQGGKQGQKGATTGAGQLHKWGSAAAAAAAAAAGSGGELSPPGRAGRKRQGALQKFVKGVNTGKVYDVRQAQDRAKADKAAAAAAAAAAGGVGAGWGRGRGRGRGRHADREAAGAAAAGAAAEHLDDDQGVMDWEVYAAYDDQEVPAAAESAGQPTQQRQQQAQANAGIRHGRHHKLGLPVQVAAYEQQLMKAKLHCRLIVLPKEGQEPVRQQDLDDPENYLHVSGQFWTSEDVEEEADPQQQEAHKQLLADMASELKQQGSLTLMGGAFDLATHPAIQTFMEDPQLSYKPLLFIVITDTDKRMVKDLLSDPRRFVVMSIESKLLVLVPTNTGHLVSVCTRELARSDDLTNEVVKTIMAHPTLGCPSQEADDGNLQSPSESLLGPPDAAPADTHQEDVKDGILQQQDRQHLNRAQSQAGETSGIAGQQRQQLPVQHLPVGMRSGHDDLQDAAARLLPALAAVAAGGQAAAGGPLAQAATAVMVAAAGAAAAAGGVLPAAAAAGIAVSGLSVPEFVKGSPLAHLLKVAGVDAAGAAEQQQQQQGKQVLTLRSCIPQLVDLAELQHLRLFVVGFPQEMLDAGGRLYNCLSAARKIVDGVYSSPRAIDALLQDLHLQVVPSCPGSPIFFTAQGSTPADATAAADGADDAAAVAEGVGETRRRSEALDFTEGPQESCYRVLLVPEHFDSPALQQLLGQVPLWRLLACSVAVFRQGPNRGILQELQRLQKQQSAAAGAGDRAEAGSHAGDGSSSSSLRMPPGIALTTQLYRDELVVVADAIALKHCSTQDIQQLMQLLRQAQALLHARRDAAASLAADNPVYLAISQQDINKLGEQQQALLKSGLNDNTVVLLDELLAPVDNDTASSAQDDADPVVAAAAKLAAQRQQQLRHVIVVAPDVGDSFPSAPRSPVSNGAAAAAAAAAASPVRSVGKQPVVSSPLQVSKGGSKGAGSGGQSAQKRSDAYEARALAGLRFKGAAQNPRLLAGTVSQTLQFLACLVENSSKATGEQ